MSPRYRQGGEDGGSGALVPKYPPRMPDIVLQGRGNKRDLASHLHLKFVVEAGGRLVFSVFQGKSFSGMFREEGSLLDEWDSE